MIQIIIAFTVNLSWTLTTIISVLYYLRVNKLSLWCVRLYYSLVACCDEPLNSTERQRYVLCAQKGSDALIIILQTALAGKSGKSTSGGKSSEDTGKARSRSAKAGLQFPVGRVHRLLKKGNYAQRVGAGAPGSLRLPLSHCVQSSLFFHPPSLYGCCSWVPRCWNSWACR